MKRRDFLKTAPVAAVAAIPVVASNSTMSREERINHHIESLLGLLREDLPKETTRISVTIGSETGEKNWQRMNVMAFRREWQADSGMPKGGMEIEHLLETRWL